MQIYVNYKEGQDASAHWRKQVTLPKKWLTSTSDRLKKFLIDNYNKAFSESPQLRPDEWHLTNESEGCCASLGSEDLISEVISAFDQIFLRPGESIERSGWHRESARPEKVEKIDPAQVIVPIDYKVLLALRAAVDADNTEALKAAVDQANITSPHELLMAEADVKDADGQVCGTEWHSVGGRFAWDSEIEGRGEDLDSKVTLTQYARRRGADRVLKLIEIADCCGAPILGSRCRSEEDIKASAGSVADQMGEMGAQLKASLEQRQKT